MTPGSAEDGRGGRLAGPRRLTGVAELDAALDRLRAVAEIAGTEADLELLVGALGVAWEQAEAAEGRARGRERMAAARSRRAEARRAERRARGWAERVAELGSIGVKEGRRRGRELAGDLEGAGLGELARAVRDVVEALGRRGAWRRTAAGRERGDLGVREAVRRAVELAEEVGGAGAGVRAGWG